MVALRRWRDGSQALRERQALAHDLFDLGDGDARHAASLADRLARRKRRR
jgi:hypothetical protein